MRQDARTWRRCRGSAFRRKILSRTKLIAPPASTASSAEKVMSALFYVGGMMSLAESNSNERTNENVERGAQCISGPDSVIARDSRFGPNGIERERERKREREMGAVRGIMQIRHDNSSGGVGGNAVKRTDERTANAAWLLSVARQLGDA